MKERLNAEAEAAQNGLDYREKLFLDEIRSKVDRHLAELCEEQGFTYVFNARASGNSTLLQSKEGINLTVALLRHMNVPVEEEGTESSEE